MNIEDIDMTLFKNVIGVQFYSAVQLIRDIESDSSIDDYNVSSIKDEIISSTVESMSKQIRLILDCEVDFDTDKIMGQALRGEIDVNNMYRKIESLYIERLSDEEVTVKERLKVINDKKTLIISNQALSH
jgi:hypothetical protein